MKISSPNIQVRGIIKHLALRYCEHQSQYKLYQEGIQRIQIKQIYKLHMQ